MESEMKKTDIKINRPSEIRVNFLNELRKLKEPVWKIIKGSLISREPKEFYKAVNEYPKRQGKYFRPGLVILGTEMFGGKREDAFSVAAAMQMSEEWLLVHDDFLDDSEERRSTKDEFRPSLNKLYGNEIAVNAGDSLHALMWKMVGDCVSQLGPERGWRVYEKFFDIITTTLEGQYVELGWARNGKIDISEKDYFKMIYIKAGYYTVTGPLQLGGLVARLGVKELEAVRKWGIPFGCAFQVQDDVLNLTTEANVSGKEKGGDIFEGKRTLSLIHLLNSCKDSENKCIHDIYLKKREAKTEEEVSYILGLMEKYGSIAYAKKKAKNLSDKALRIFDNQTPKLPESEAKRIVREGIRFVVDRDR